MSSDLDFILTVLGIFTFSFFSFPGNIQRSSFCSILLLGDTLCRFVATIGHA